MYQATEWSSANEIDLRDFAPTRRHKRMIVSQSEDVETDVLNALYWDLAVPPHRLKIEIENGWVTMSGTVDRPYQSACAESDARRVPGVVGVNNQIRLAPAQAE
jgi:osmotically-inducible protein OsmY